MAVFNGAPYLPAQLDSLIGQTHTDWQLVVGDDGSTDGSATILADFADTHGKMHPVEVVQGPRAGAAANFIHILAHISRTAPNTDWIAFADQDDVWLPEKLARAQGMLREIDPSIPALYCGRTWITKPDLSGRRLSVPRPRAPGFANALVQNIAAGNTMLLNPAAVRLVLRHAPHTAQVVIHDWWVYLLVTGAGGHVLHDDSPHILYRQHAANQIGANDRARARLDRFIRLLQGDFRDWNRINVAALGVAHADLTPDNRALLAAFAALPDVNVWRGLASLRKLRLYRQTKISSAALWLAVLIRRI